MISIVNGVTNRTKTLSLVIGLIGLAGCAVGWVVSAQEFFIAYLFAVVFFLGLSLGSLGLLMIHHLTAGYWGYSVRRFFEAAIANLPLLGLLFVPIFFGLPQLYPWKNPAVVAASEILQKKQAYLTTPWFVIRTVAVFVIWSVMARFLLKWSANRM